MANFKLTEEQCKRLVKEEIGFIYLTDNSIPQNIGNTETTVNSMVGREGDKNFTSPTITDKVQRINGPRFNTFKRKI